MPGGEATRNGEEIALTLFTYFGSVTDVSVGAADEPNRSNWIGDSSAKYRE